MQLRIATDQPWDSTADVLALAIVDEPSFEGPLGEINRRSGGELAALATFGELTGKRYHAALAASGDLPAGRLLVIGAGKSDALNRETIHRLGAAIERRLAGRAVRSLAIWLGDLGATVEGGDATVVELLARGVVEGSYEPKSIYLANVESAPPALDELILIVPGGDGPGLAKAAERGRIMAEGANVARNLANRASNDVSPIVLAEAAQDIAARNGLTIDVIEPDRAAELGMGMFLAVGRGSDNPPRMIVMRSGGAGELDGLGRHLAIVGKGVCFDSGGISIKPADRMEEMKMDKTGAATVIAAIETVARLAPGTPLLAIAPAVENMPGPHSTRPGDVVRAMNGKQVDITNTDAEGRLILGDALTYAEQLGATHLVDVATLTGAVSRALGHLITGAFGTPQSWYDSVMAAGAAAGETYWQIPLFDDYVPDMDSWYGDLQNAGPAEGS
ncbi:MAG TPA: M17 family peptidase N-terminal domain-containing protein, partial [Candidatus Limnocylindrales bacterium]